MLSAYKAYSECGMNWLISIWSICEQGAVVQCLVQVNDCFLVLCLPVIVGM